MNKYNKTTGVKRIHVIYKYSIHQADKAGKIRNTFKSLSTQVSRALLYREKSTLYIRYQRRPGNLETSDKHERCSVGCERNHPNIQKSRKIKGLHC